MNKSAVMAEPAEDPEGGSGGGARRSPPVRLKGMGAAPVRARVAVALLVLAALGSSARLLVEAVRGYAGWDGRDPVAEYRDRFVALRPLLPRHGRVGYVSDDPGAAREYYLAQYTLAPLVLDRHAPGDLAVGNFFDPDQAAGVAAKARLAILADLGDGVLLFRGAER